MKLNTIQTHPTPGRGPSWVNGEFRGLRTPPEEEIFTSFGVNICSHTTPSQQIGIWFGIGIFKTEDRVLKWLYVVGWTLN